MPNAYILATASKIRLVSKTLVVENSDPEIPDAVLRFQDFEQLIVQEDVQITTQAMLALVKQGLSVVFVDARGNTAGHLTGPVGKHGHWRQLQMRHSLYQEKRIEVARALIQAKIHNQRRFLGKLRHQRPEQVTEPELAKFAIHFEKAGQADTLEVLLGQEGISTRLWFQCWSRFLPEAFPFEKRMTRPPGNAVNACLSYGSSLIYQEMVHWILQRGLDPAIGMLHATKNDRYSLALDLIEPFRSVVVEMFTLRLFSQKMLKEGDFRPVSGGVYLNRHGKKKFLNYYEKRMQRKFLDVQKAERISLRKRMDLEVASYKKSLDRSAPFKPFHMP